MQQVQLGNWNEMNWQQSRPLAKKVLLGTEAEQVSVMVTEMERGVEAKPHSHPHEQISIVLEGSCDYYLDGKKYELTAGAWVYNPPELEHYSIVTSDKMVIMDVFAPARTEFVKSYLDFISEK